MPPPSEELDPMEGALGEGALGSFVGEKRKKRRKKQSYYSDDGLDDGFNEVIILVDEYLCQGGTCLDDFCGVCSCCLPRPFFLVSLIKMYLLIKCTRSMILWRKWKCLRAPITGTNSRPPKR